MQNRCIAMSACLLILASQSAWAQPTFDKSFNPAIIGPGSQSQLTFTISNNDPVNPVTNLAFVDNLPAGMTIAAPSQADSECINGLVVAPNGGNTITFTDGRLSAATTCTIRVNVTAGAAGTYTNTSGDLTSSAGNSGSASDDLEVDVAIPGFSKSFSPATVNFGDRARLTFTIDNLLNSSNAFSLSFTDVLPVGMVVADPPNPSSSCSGGTLTAVAGSGELRYGPTFPGDASVLAGASCEVSLDVRAQARGVLNNTSGNLSASAPSFVISGFSGAVLNVNSADDLNVTHQFIDDPTIPGDSVTVAYTVSSVNRDFDLTDITFSHDLTAIVPGLIATGLPLNDVCGAGSSIAGTTLLTLSSASLGPEQSCTFNVTLLTPAAAVAASYPSVVTGLTGQITGMTSNGNDSTDTLTLSEAPTLTKTFLTDPIGTGDTVTMEFTLTNNSATSTATDITFTDNLAAFISGISVTALPANNFCGAGSIAFTFLSLGELTLQVTGANLMPAASCTFSVDLSIPTNTPAGTYTNTTNPVSATVDGVTQFGLSATDELTLVDAPLLRAEFINDPVLPGDTVTLEYTLTHNEFAVADATGISFSNDLNTTLTGLAAVGLPLTDVCGVGSQLSGTGNLTLTGGTLTPGETCVISVSLQVPVGALPGSYTNTTSTLMATVSGVMATSDANVETLNVGGLQFTKAFINDPVVPGGQVTLEFSIDNSSMTADATAMSFTDSLSAVLPGLTAIDTPQNDICGPGSQLTGTTFLILGGGNLTAGESCTFSVTAQVPAAANDGTYSNTTSSLVATVAGTMTSIPPATDTLTVNSNLILASKSFVDDPVQPGDSVTLEFTLSNQDPVNALTGIAFTDDLDATLSGLVAAGLPANNGCGAGSQLSGTSVLTFTGGSLPAGGTCSFQVNLQVPAGATPGIYNNTTSAFSGTAGGFPATGDPAQDTLQIDLTAFSKAFAGPVNTGDTTTLTFSLINNSPSAQSNLRFTDDLNAVIPGLAVSGALPTDPCGVGSTLTGTSLLTFGSGSLASGGSCTFDVTVQVPAGLPTGVFQNITSDLTSNAQILAGPAMADLMVMGLPALGVAPASLDFGDIRVGATSGTQTVTISNSGTEVLTVTALDAASGPFAQAATGSCAATPFVVPVAGSCTVEYLFTPSVIGPATQTLSITSNDAFGNPNSFDLTGNGIQAGLSITPNPINFGNVLINTTSGTLTATLDNTGDADLNITSIGAATAPFALVGGSCGAAPITLTPAATCTLDYSYAPTTVGAANQDLSIVSDAPSSPDTLSLQGNATQPGLALTPATLDFGTVTINTTESLTTTVSNTGDGDLIITAITAATAPFAANGGSCAAVPFTLAPTASCTLIYDATPTALGMVNQTIQIDSTAPTSPDTLNLAVEGVEPVLTLDLNTINFPNVIVGSDAVQAVTLSNNGPGTVTINQLTDPGAPFSVDTGTCGPLPIVLLDGTSCIINITFSPTAIGSASGSLDVISNASNSPQTITLSAFGIMPLPVPALGLWSLLLLSTLMLALLWRHKRVGVRSVY